MVVSSTLEIILSTIKYAPIAAKMLKKCLFIADGIAERPFYLYTQQKGWPVSSAMMLTYFGFSGMNELLPILNGYNLVNGYISFKKTPGQKFSNGVDLCVCM